MKDIYDIKTFLFGFIYSHDYLFTVFSLFFLILFYFLVVHFLEINPKLAKKVKNSNNYLIKSKFSHLVRNLETFSRENFYREISLLIKMLMSKKLNDDGVFFMTLKEIESNYFTEYNEILKEAYFLEFNNKLEDSTDLRERILKKIKETHFF